MNAKSLGIVPDPTALWVGQTFSMEVRAKPALVTRCLHSATLELSVKGYIVPWGRTSSGVAGMTGREEYLLRAAALSAKAQAETDHARKVEIENLARAYLRLAEQAERNSRTDIVYGTPAKKGGRAKA